MALYSDNIEIYEGVNEGRKQQIYKKNKLYITTHTQLPTCIHTAEVFLAGMKKWQ